MDETTNKDHLSVYEIGYLMVSSIPEEKLVDETATLKSLVEKNGGSIIAEEAPKRHDLAYSMSKKTVSGSYDNYDQAYFGWVKFEIEPGKVESVKNAFETQSSILRILLISTVRENTYLGKRASSIAADLAGDKDERSGSDRAEKNDTENEDDSVSEQKPKPSVEEMDKSIDEMVKEAV